MKKPIIKIAAGIVAAALLTSTVVLAYTKNSINREYQDYRIATGIQLANDKATIDANNGLIDRQQLLIQRDSVALVQLHGDLSQISTITARYADQVNTIVNLHK